VSDDDVTAEDLDQGPVYGASLTPEPSIFRRGLRRVRRQVGGNRPAPYEVVNLDLPADVIVYFADDRARLYQLEQWVPALEALAETRRVILVLRNSGTVRSLEGATKLPTVFIRTLRQLMELYDGHDYKVALYVNHSRANFQSLMAAKTIHAHINHGESDKRSSYSNQVRGYNRVFVAGENAASRYREELLELSDSHIVQIGRPQLDTVFPPLLESSERVTLLYAPTWEGETEDNNWTSLDLYGRDIVRSMLSVPDSRVVYKPHPRVATTTSHEVAAAHRDICAMLERAAAAEPQAGHLMVDGEILAMLPQCDAMISDVSTVALDYLYLCPERPLFLTDRRSDRPQLVDDSPLAHGVDVIDADSLAGFAELLPQRLESDARQPDRERLRSYYFGDLRRGESTARFVNAVSDLCDQRDRLVAERTALIKRSAGLRDQQLGSA
jgi:CDP-Glycerol:Poly(glycerophosphate) glycerophosphotransferase